VSLLLLAAPAVAASDYVYKWIDDDGVVRLSGSLEAAPEKYRASARRIASETAGAETIEPPPRAIGAHGKTTARLVDSVSGLAVTAVFDATVTRDAIIDTGSEWVTITTKLARALGYDPAGAARRWVRTSAGPALVPVVTLKSVHIGAAGAEMVRAAVIDFEARGPVSAALGMNFLSVFVFEIDPAHGTFSLYAGGAGPSTAEEPPPVKSSDAR